VFKNAKYAYLSYLSTKAAGNRGYHTATRHKLRIEDKSFSGNSIGTE